MAQRTTADERQSRQELAEYFQTLADAFGSDEESISVAVGNKTVRLSPPETVGVSVDVVERSSRFRGDHEQLEIDISWTP